jgi:hypothetical protein
MTVTNCTIAFNNVNFSNGGGIENQGTLTVTNSTIVFNNAALGGSGGGLAAAGATATLNNTIVALNTRGSGAAGTTASDIALTGGAVSGSSNLIGTGGSGSLVDGVNGNQVGVANPGLATALANNGGPTQTIALLPGSRAIDKGSNSLAIDPTTNKPLSTDQRGTGFPRIVNSTVDIGAYEFPANPVVATKLVVSTQPPVDVAAGTGFGLSVSAEDSSGNLDPTFAGSVTIALLNNPGGASLGGTLTVTPQSGVAKFPALTLDKPGTGYTLQVTTSGLTGTVTDAIDIQANLLANGNFSLGNTGFTSQYTYSPNSVESEGTYAIGTNPAPLHPPNAVSFGDHTTVAGLMFITNGAPSSSTIMWQESVNVTNDTNYIFSGWASSWDSADGFPARLRFFVNGVQIGSDFTTYSIGGEWKQFTAPWSSGTSGIATITVVDENTVAVGNDFVVDDFAFTSPATNHLTVTPQLTGSVTAGSGFGLTVTAEDASGNTLTSFNGSVAVALATNPGGSTLGGMLTATAQNGVAKFSGLTLNKVGMGYTLLVTATGLASATAGPFNVTPATATQLFVTTQPQGSVLVGAGFGLVAVAEDKFENLATSFGGTVAVALLNNPGRAALGGMTSVMAQGGVATFSGLTLSEPGIGYTLNVTSTGLTLTTTNGFNVQTTIAAVSAGWGTQTAPLQTAADGLRLLPAGRNTDLPWVGINQLPITLAQATSLAAGDVKVSGITVANYGPVTISGSGTSYTITFAQPINKADRVTITIANAAIATFTRRLDVLPGDFNDDGVVNSADLTGVRNEILGFNGAAPTVFGDINGDGKVDINDYNLVKKFMFTSLPKIA